MFERTKSGNVDEVTKGLQQIKESEMKLETKDARKLIKVLSSSTNLISNKESRKATKQLTIAIVESVEVMKGINLDEIPNEEKSEILETVEAVSRSVEEGQSVKTSSIAAQSVRTQDEEMDLMAPESVPSDDLPIKLNFGHHKGQLTSIALMDQSFEDILPKVADSNATLDSPIVSLNFMSPEGKAVKNISFSLIFKQKEHSEYPGFTLERKCVYLNTTTNTWLSNGCITQLNADKTCTCTCSHTTSFAVLLSPTPVTDHEGQEATGYTMFAINILFLTLAICLIAPFKKLRRKQVVMMQLCLVLMLILGNITFVVLSASTTVVVDDKGTPLLSLNAGCVTGVIISQYFFLSAFFWMGCIAWTFFNKIVRAVKTFGKTDKHYFRNCALLSWICPVIFPIASLLFSLIPNKGSDYPMPYVGANIENGVTHCWVEDPWRYIGFLVPAYLILLFNCVCFGMVAKVILNSTGKPGGGDAVSVKTAKAMMVVAVSVGIPWIVAGLAVGPGASFMQYLFIIFMGLQGPLLFVALVVLQDDAKEHTQHLLMKFLWKERSLLRQRQKELSPKTSKDGTLQTQILKNDSGKEPTTSESDDGTRAATSSKTVTTL